MKKRDGYTFAVDDNPEPGEIPVADNAIDQLGCKSVAVNISYIGSVLSLLIITVILYLVR